MSCANAWNKELPLNYWPQYLDLVPFIWMCVASLFIVIIWVLFARVNLNKFNFILESDDYALRSHSVIWELLYHAHIYIPKGPNFI